MLEARVARCVLRGKAPEKPISWGSGAGTLGRVPPSVKEVRALAKGPPAGGLRGGAPARASECVAPGRPLPNEPEDM